jgi:hypothetical protein
MEFKMIERLIDSVIIIDHLKGKIEHTKYKRLQTPKT